jgi:hypothetical protein
MWRSVCDVRRQGVGVVTGEWCCCYDAASTPVAVAPATHGRGVQHTPPSNACAQRRRVTADAPRCVERRALLQGQQAAGKEQHQQPMITGAHSGAYRGPGYTGCKQTASARGIVVDRRLCGAQGTACQLARADCERRCSCHSARARPCRTAGGPHTRTGGALCGMRGNCSVHHDAQHSMQHTTSPEGMQHMSYSDWCCQRMCSPGV